MKERPILFRTPTVQAILAGRKTQTRRVLKPQPEHVWGSGIHQSDNVFRAHVRYPGGTQPDPLIQCPYGSVGDRLWVRETWVPVPEVPDKCLYRADPMFNGMDIGDFGFSWKPSIYMPRWACRLVLEITEVRVQRLQEITWLDICAEGVETPPPGRWHVDDPRTDADQYAAWDAWVLLWNSINGKKYPWSINPWVWALSFKQVTP